MTPLPLKERQKTMLPEGDGYFHVCRLGRGRLEDGQITFKQMPYDLQV